MKSTSVCFQKNGKPRRCKGLLDCLIDRLPLRLEENRDTAVGQKHTRPELSLTKIDQLAAG